jgi:hypothetical protein
VPHFSPVLREVGLPNEIHRKRHGRDKLVWDKKPSGLKSLPQGKSLSAMRGFFASA